MECREEPPGQVATCKWSEGFLVFWEQVKMIREGEDN
jgi:hypothetical protein